MADVGLTFPRISVPQVVPQDDLQISSTTILFRLDSVAQERNETFNLTFTFSPLDLGTNPTVRNVLPGVVIDATRKSYIM